MKMEKITIKDAYSDNPNVLRVTDGMLMVCLCDEDGTNVVPFDSLLESSEMCSKHPSTLKLESLIRLGFQCLLFTEVDGEPVPLRTGNT